ncbi:MAG TPA: hypothetical protein VKC90_06130 [Chitinophagaceae bacterium]|nr:hypothetical protein [Chitinophagaceae bacterium]
MKKIANKVAMTSLLVFTCATLFSFNRIAGGDSFQVYLNGKLVLDKALYKNKDIQNLEFAQASINDKIEICYNHCGRTGTSRSITAKDEKQKVLKTWHFPDASSKNMSLKLQELRELQTNSKGSSIGLYYSAKELPAGQQLASVSVSNKSIAAK